MEMDKINIPKKEQFSEYNIYEYLSDKENKQMINNYLKKDEHWIRDKIYAIRNKKHIKMQFGILKNLCHQERCTLVVWGNFNLMLDKTARRLLQTFILFNDFEEKFLLLRNLKCYDICEFLTNKSEQESYDLAYMQKNMTDLKEICSISDYEQKIESIIKKKEIFETINTEKVRCIKLKCIKNILNSPVFIQFCEAIEQEDQTMRKLICLIKELYSE